MLRFLCASAACLAVLSAPALCGASTAEADRAALLAGVDAIVVPGGIPGDIAVYGPDAFVVLTGRTGGARLPVVAAARYGKGRAVAMGHESFAGAGPLRNPGNRRLVSNAVAWCSAHGGRRVGLVGQSAELRDVLAAGGATAAVVNAPALPGALAGIDVLWLGQGSLDGPANAGRVKAVRDWVRQGGGVILAGPAWGWQMLHPNQTLQQDHSGSALLKPMGLTFSTAMLEPTRDGAYAVEGDDPDAAHAAVALSGLEKASVGGAQLDKKMLTQYGAVLGYAVRSAPAAWVGRARNLASRAGGPVVPTRARPVGAADALPRLAAVLDASAAPLTAPGRVRAHPAAASFPGAVPADSPRVRTTLSVDTARSAWHPTGLYAPPGQVVRVTLPAQAAGKGLSVRIGAHTDTLWHLDAWWRFPEVSAAWPLRAAQTSVASPFGGLIYLDVPEASRLGVLSVSVDGGVEAPNFVRGKTTAAEWQRLRALPAPWADLEGKLISLVVPAEVVRDLDDPEALMAYWDEVAELCYSLYGAPKRGRPERYCVDRQISAGYMHSGYPIMTFEDVARRFVNLKELRAREAPPLWGFYHELGHNFQRGEWTWDSMGEVTNNLFSLYAAEKLNGVTSGAHPAMTDDEVARRRAEVAARPGAEPYYRRDPWYPLTMFVLLQREFGWEAFTRTFVALQEAGREADMQTDAGKQARLAREFSRVVGRDVGPYLRAWGVNAPEGGARLPVWMPAGWGASPAP